MFTIIHKKDPGQGSENRYKALLVVRRRNGRYELYVDFNAPVVPRNLDRAGYSFSLASPLEGSPRLQQWTSDKTSTAMFYNGDVLELINSMKGKKWFYPVFIDNNEDMFLSSFDVTGVFESCVKLQSKR